MEQISELGQFSCLNTLSRLSGLKFFLWTLNLVDLAAVILKLLLKSMKKSLRIRFQLVGPGAAGKGCDPNRTSGLLSLIMGANTVNQSPVKVRPTAGHPREDPLSLPVTVTVLSPGRTMSLILVTVAFWCYKKSGHITSIYVHFNKLNYKILPCRQQSFHFLNHRDLKN